MKLAILSPTLDVKNGYGNMTFEFCRQLVREGIPFVLFLPTSEKSKDYQVNFEVEYLLPEYIFRFKTPKFLSYLFRDINLSGFTLVHSLFDFPYNYYAARLAKKYHLPFISGAQGTYAVLPLTYWPEKYFLKSAYRTAKAVVVPSQFTKEQIARFAQEQYNIQVVHNGVNFQRFNQDVNVSDLKEKYSGYKIILTVGGLKARKGQDLVIDSLVTIRESVPNIKYLIIGRGSWREYLEQLVKDKGLRNEVEFLGAVSDDDLVKYFKLCDIYVHTPRMVNLNFEGFGIVYLEASACGKPIVATDAGGIKDAVVNGETGFVVGDGEVQAIADSIISLLSNDELVKKIGAQGRIYAQDHDWSIIVKKFIDLYHKYSL